MSLDPNSSPNLAAPRPSSPAHPPRADFRALAKRIAGRTTDLIAIGVVLVGGLTLGRQVLEWWRADPPEMVAAMHALPGGTGPWGAANTPVRLEFGEYPLALWRETIAGDREAAMTALVAACRAAVQGGDHTSGISGTAAEELLSRTASLEPVVEEPGRWQVYRLEDRFPLVIGVRTVADESRAGDAGQSRHLICWGLAAPIDQSAWTLYTFLPSSTGTGASNSIAEIPLPDGCRRILAIRGEAGVGLIGFGGEGNPEEWMGSFDDRLRSQGWSPTQGWTSGPKSWSAQFTPDESSAKGRVAIEFSGDGTGALTGLILIEP
jgi:hypothetical protein